LRERERVEASSHPAARCGAVRTRHDESNSVLAIRHLLPVYGADNLEGFEQDAHAWPVRGSPHQLGYEQVGRRSTRRGARVRVLPLHSSLRPCPCQAPRPRAQRRRFRWT